MALVKISGVKVTVENNLKYITNHEKTNYGMLVDGINTFSDPKKASHDMLNYREQYGIKRKNQVFHIIHSFNGKDKLDPVTAHEISMKWSKEVFPNNSMYVMATHTNTQNLHTHFTINSTTKDGYSISFSKAWHRKAKEVSNRLCREYGLVNSIIKDRPYRSQYKHYAEWKACKEKKSWKNTIREEIDQLIPKSSSMDQLISLLNAKGYTFKEGKVGLMVKAPGQERFISLHRLGTGYSTYALERYIRIMNKYPDTRYVKKQQGHTILNAIDILTKNGGKLKELQKQQEEINKSNDPLDKIRVKELNKEIRDTLEADRYLKSIHMSLEDRLKAKEELFKEIKLYNEREIER